MLTDETPRSASPWVRWHGAYADPTSGPARRLVAVQTWIRTLVDESSPGPFRVLSLCAGQAHDIAGALSGHARAKDVIGALIERDQENVRIGRIALAKGGLTNLQVVCGDAGATNDYLPGGCVDLLLLCGIFGNIPDRDIEHTVRSAPAFCAKDAAVIWTRHRRPPDLTPNIRSWFEESGFEEIAFESPEDQSFGVGVHRLAIDPLTVPAPKRLFTFERGPTPSRSGNS